MDKQLDQEAQQEKPAFEELWASNAPLLRRYCLKWVREHADEALSRTAYIAFLRYSQCTANSVSWLKRVTRNVCNDMHRDRMRTKAEPIDDVEVFAAVSERLTAADDPETRIIRRERAAIVVHALSQLPPLLSEPLLLKAVHGLSNREIALRLSITETTLRKRFSTARKLLRDAAAGARPPRVIGQDIDWSIDDTPVTSMASEWGDTLPDPSFVAPVLIRAGQIECDGAITIGEQSPDPSPSTVRALERYVARYPSGWKRRMKLARLLRTTGDAVGAAEHYGAVLARKPELIAARAEAAEVYLALGRSEEAEAVYRQIASRGRGRDRIVAEALASRAGGRNDEAVAQLDSLLATDSDDAGAWHIRGETLLERGSIVEAISSLRCAAALREHHSLTLTRLGEALLDAGHSAEARDTLQRAYAADRSNTLALTHIARMHIDARSPRAGELVAELVRLAPEHAVTAAVAAHELLVAGNAVGARMHLHSYVDRHPRHARAWLALAELLHQIGDEGPSRKALMHALETDPADSGLRNAAIVLSIRLRDEQWHSLALESAALTDDWRVTASVLRALLDTRQDLDAAPLLGAIACALQPRLAQSWSLYGRALEAAGDLCSADTAWKRSCALEADENSQRREAHVSLSTRA